MCRLNLILVKEKVAEEILLVEGYDKIYDNLMGYNAFQKGHCNCGSLVGSMCDKKELGLEYFEIAENCKKEELKRLCEIRDFMNQPEYREKRQEFENIKTQLQEEMERFRNHIIEYEIEQQEEIEENYSGEEYNQKIEELYQRIDELNWEVENTPAYQMKMNEYFKFINENGLLNDSTYYYLSEEEEEKAIGEGSPLKELFGEDFQMSEEDLVVEEIFDLEEKSSAIDKVIEEEENNIFQKEKEEYNSYYELFTKLLVKVDSFLFATIQSEPNERKKVKDVDIKSLIIDDLAFLEDDDMVCVTRESK